MMEKGIWQEIEELYMEFQQLGISQSVDYEKYYLYSLITHSTAIEGSTLTEMDAQLLFDEGVTAKGKPLVYHLMNEDLKKAYELAKEEAQCNTAITPAFLQKLNATLMRTTGGIHNTIGGSFDSSRGEFRLCGVTAGVGGRSYMGYQKVSAKVEDHAEKLLKGRKRSETPDWFLYGRTQALKDVCILKYAVNTCIKGVESIKLTEVPPGCGLYSGLYILPDKGVTFDMLDRIIRNEEFIRYVSLLKNYKSGGYYTFNSKDLELYINYKIQLEYGKGRDNLSTGQLGLFESAY